MLPVWPAPGLPDVRQRDSCGPGFDLQGEGEGDPRPGPRGLPMNILLLDYAVRLLVLALPAWFGVRWLAAPMRRLAAASREVRETAQVFNAMARQLREQFCSRGLMVAAISHDLRAPLTWLRMRLEMMDADVVQQQRAVGDLREMNALVDNVLDIFRNDAAASQEPLQKTDIATLLQSLTDDLIGQGQPVTQTGLENAITLAQPAALQRAISNIIGNALRYGNRAGVHIALTDTELLVTIDDTGPGIPAAHVVDVFQPFFRVESSCNQSAPAARGWASISPAILCRGRAGRTAVRGFEGGVGVGRR